MSRYFAAALSNKIKLTDRNLSSLWLSTMSTISTIVTKYIDSAQVTSVYKAGLTIFLLG